MDVASAIGNDMLWEEREALRSLLLREEKKKKKRLPRKDAKAAKWQRVFNQMENNALAN